MMKNTTSAYGRGGAGRILGMLIALAVILIAIAVFIRKSEPGIASVGGVVERVEQNQSMHDMLEAEIGTLE